jgi:hypothetical protein
MQDFDLEVQQLVPSPWNNESMILSRPSYVTSMNVFGEK